MSRYFLSTSAQNDLIALSEYYIENATPSIARRMVAETVNALRTLARNPGLGSKREDLAEDRSILFWAVRNYLISYRDKSDPLELFMIARASRDIPLLFTQSSV